MSTMQENQMRAAALMENLHALKGTLGIGTDAWRSSDPVEVARSLYVSGAIDLDTFEARLDVAFSRVAA